MRIPHPPPPHAFYYNGPVCKKVIIYCCYYLSWAIHLCVFTGQSSPAATDAVFPCLFLTLSGGERMDTFTLFTHVQRTWNLYFRLFFFFFLKHVHVLFLHAGDTVHSMCLFICAADRRLKMTVNEGLIPLGTLQNPIPSTEISSFQLSYLSYLFIFSQPGLMLPPLSLFLVSSLSHSYFLCTLICFFPLSLSPLATREPVSHFD